MKKNIIYFFVLTVVLVLSACEDDEKVPSISGEWFYSSPHVVFEYPESTIDIETMQGQSLSVETGQVRDMLAGMIARYAGSYLKGVTFKTDRRMLINMRMGPVENSVEAEYLQAPDFIQVVLDTNALKQPGMENIPAIPPLSFQYSLNGDLALYFSKIYTEMVIYIMMDRIIEMMIPMITQGMPEHIKPVVIPKIRESLKVQIPLILDNITEMEIGIRFRP